MGATLEKLAARRNYQPGDDPNITPVRPTPQYDNRTDTWDPALNAAERVFVTGMETLSRANEWLITVPKKVVTQAKEAANDVPTTVISEAGRITARIATALVEPKPTKQKPDAVIDYGYVPPKSEGVIANIAGVSVMLGMAAVGAVKDIGGHIYEHATHGLRDAGRVLCRDVADDMAAFKTRIELPEKPEA